jgi:hypothetical protein
MDTAWPGDLFDSANSTKIALFIISSIIMTFLYLHLYKLDLLQEINQKSASTTPLD